jgi:hypothetical protein
LSKDRTSYWHRPESDTVTVSTTLTEAEDLHRNTGGDRSLKRGRKNHWIPFRINSGVDHV